VCQLEFAGVRVPGNPIVSVVNYQECVSLLDLFLLLDQPFLDDGLVAAKLHLDHFVHHLVYFFNILIFLSLFLIFFLVDQKPFVYLFSFAAHQRTAHSEVQTQMTAHLSIGSPL
jgi:hypothetical protein